MNVETAQRLADLRRSKGFSQEGLARKLGLSRQAVSKWENGTAYPDITIIPSLAVFFNISIDELFDFDKTKIESEIIAVVDEAYKYRHDYPNKSAAILKAG
ncbi:MAG: helix-turn-helix domain-containing protein, partial [Collinsella aerofaciens]|nr:helix-turn-helix domain-containing protein [Collinsella aerofaciens]